MYLFILVASPFVGIAYCGLDLVLDGGASNNRMGECAGGPYLEAPGCCDEKWNVGGERK